MANFEPNTIGRGGRGGESRGACNASENRSTTIPRTSFCSRSRVIFQLELIDATIPSTSYRSTSPSDDSRPRSGARKHAAGGRDPGGRRPSVRLSQDGDRTAWRKPSQSRRHGTGRGPRGATPGLWTVEPSLPDQPENPLARG